MSCQEQQEVCVSVYQITSRSESAVAVLLTISTTVSDYYIVLKVLLLGPGLSVL